MLHKVSHRARDDRGYAQFAVLGTIAIAVVVAMIATASLAVAGPVERPNPAAAGQALLRDAEASANAIAASHGGSSAQVGKLSMHKEGLIRFQRSSTAPWVSSVSSTADSYTLSVTAEPTGKTVTVSRDG